MYCAAYLSFCSGRMHKDLGLKGPGLGLEGSGLGPGLEILAFAKMK